MQSAPFASRARHTIGLVRNGATGWAVTCWIVVFWRLGYLPLSDPDEAHYAEITREMSAAHEWLVPLLDGKPYIDKPVLFHWLQGTALWLFGQTEFAARMPSALAALLLMAITAWCGRHLFGRRTGDRAALLLATLPATFALSRIAIFDMVFTTCLFGAFACLAVGALEQRPRLQDVGFVLAAVAVLTKGPVAVILLAITACLCLAYPSTRAATRRVRWLRGLAIVTVIGAPWFLWMWYRFGHTFVQLYVLENNVWLFGRPLYRRQRHPFFFARVLLTWLLPWSLLLIGRAVHVVRRPARLRDLTAGELALWTWSVTIVTFFSFSWFKLNTYVYPAAPAICLLASHAWERWWPRTRGVALIVPLLCAYATVVVVGFPLVRQARPTMDIARWVASTTAPDVALAVYRLSRWQASLRFYASRPVVVLHSPEDLRRFLHEQPNAQCVVTQRDFDDLRGAGLALRSVYRRDAVVGHERQGLRRLQWGAVLVVIQAPTPATVASARTQMLGAPTSELHGAIHRWEMSG
jgi:4-amino-4-deoxy-L-arabinose transferase-like glycosyltransferase